ncbi:MAG: glycosyltransferase [Anaerolineae bacterium]|nr:glycosyltransferase [Anaerolineae bacterium]
MSTLLSAVYMFCALCLALYTGSQLLLIVLYLRHRHEHPQLPQMTAYPKVAIQLPLYNEKFVVEPLLDAIAQLDYPRDRLIVQVLDDSTDETIAIVAHKVAQLQAFGLNIEHIQREHRVGYKAGAMAYGLTLLDDVEFIAIFDADFLPPSNFLKQTIPHFSTNPKLAIVQTRWGHTNVNANWLTSAQSLAIDAHFVVEQKARNGGGLLLTFNGTGGVWRKQAIIDSGGWSASTLTEDLDLSYRAQIRGWQYLYLPEIVVPGEIPPVMMAYKRQQARWAQGTNQCLIKLFGPVWRSSLTLGQKLMATQHLVQYLPHSFMLLLLLLTPIMILMGAFQNLPLAWMGLLGVVPPIMHLFAQTKLHQDHWVKRILYFPVLMIIGTGIMWNNVRAAFNAFKTAFTHAESEFKRTPKFGKGHQTHSYKLRADWSRYVELALAIYAIWGLVVALQLHPTVAPYMALYAISFTIVFGWDFYDRWQLQRQADAETPASEITTVSMPIVEAFPTLDEALELEPIAEEKVFS